jgi:hypothetical protein
LGINFGTKLLFAYATSELMNPQVKIDAHVESRIMASIKLQSESSILEKDTEMQINFVPNPHEKIPYLQLKFNTK